MPHPSQHLADSVPSQALIQDEADAITQPTAVIPSENEPWQFSEYELYRRRGSRSFAVRAEHPNHLGTPSEDGPQAEQSRTAERARLARFQSMYISRQFHLAATHVSKGFRPWLLQNTILRGALQSCAKKTCFRQEDLRFDLHQPQTVHTVTAEEGVPYFLCRSITAVKAAQDLYGPFVTSDMELGFTRPISVNEDLPRLPTVEELVNGDATSVADPTTLSVVVSYRHTTKKSGNILNIEDNAWSGILTTLRVMCREANRKRFRLWTDQVLSSRKPGDVLRWVSSGILPYTVYPVLYLKGQRVQADMRRMWISVEHLAAALGQGIIHAGHSLDEDELPKEWPTMYISVSKSHSPITWVTGTGKEAHAVIRQICGAVLMGLMREKELSWSSDAQDIIDWASAITSAQLYRDVGHSLACDDCKRPQGYTSGNRMMALFSTATPIFPTIRDLLFNNTHPRLDVPAVRLGINGHSWDGFREWIPETCLWGADLDESRSTRQTLVHRIQGIVSSTGGPRCVAVLRFAMPDGTTGIVSAAHMLVGLTTHPTRREVGRVDWTKRFWPMEPLRMYENFNAVHQRLANDDALVSMAHIISASSGLHYEEFTEATEVGRLNMRRVRWN